MFPIQYKTYDYIYDGKDVIGQARECRVIALGAFSRRVQWCLPWYARVHVYSDTQFSYV